MTETISSRGIVAAVAALSLLWLAVINTGTIEAYDTTVRIDMAHAWWSGSAEVPPPPKNQPLLRDDPELGVLAPNGKRLGFYEPGQPLLMLPVDWLASKLLAWKLHRRTDDPVLRAPRRLLINWLVFVPLSLASVLACFWLLRLLGFAGPLAGLASILWLIGTTVLPYAQVPQEENPVLLFVTLAYAAALASDHGRRLRYLLLSGAAASGALLVRVTSAIHVLTVGLFLLVCISGGANDRKQQLKSLAAWACGFAPLALLGRWYDYVRYGSFWMPGERLWAQKAHSDPLFAALPPVPANYPFDNAMHVGIFGTLLSPAKSLFIYDPLLLPCLIVALALWTGFPREMRWYVVLGLFNLLLFILLTSRLEFWHGDWAWGARYHVTSVQLLLIPLVASVLELARNARSLIAWPLRVSIAIAIVVQAAAILLPYQLELLQEQLAMAPTCITSDAAPLSFRLGRRLVNIACLVDGTVSTQCPDELESRVRAAPGSACAVALQGLEMRKHVHLLPFIASRLGVPWLLAPWSIALLLAALWTGRWFSGLSPSLKRFPGGEFYGAAERASRRDQ